MILPRFPAGTGQDAPGSGGCDPEPLTISQVLHDARRVLERSIPDVTITGELSRWFRSARGHCYFTLRDEATQLRGVLFHRDALKLRLDPDVGTEVIVRGALSAYPAHGELQIRARVLRPLDDRGAWQRRLEALREQFRAEGLLDPARKRRLPALPAKIGIVTSAKAAALQDILTVLHRRYPCCEVLLAPARVQGPGADQEIAEAIRRVGGQKVDIVILGRGGGSVEDLAAFNTETVARAVAASPVPIVSAVGHETDFTICDLVADLRAPTPSAAAELVAPDVLELRARLCALAEERRAAVERRLMGAEIVVSESRVGVRRGMAGMLRLEDARLGSSRPERLQDALRGLVLRYEQELRVLAPERLHAHLHAQVRRAETVLEAARPEALASMAHAVLRLRDAELASVGTVALKHLLDQRITVVHGQVDAARSELESLSPTAALRRGWALLYSSSNKLVCGPELVLPGDQIRIVMGGGAILARAEEIHLHTEESYESE